MSGEKMKTTEGLRSKRARPLTSADHINSSQAEWERGIKEKQKQYRSSVRISVLSCRDMDSCLLRVPIKRRFTPAFSPDYFIPLFTADVKENGASLLLLCNSLGGGDESKLLLLLFLLPCCFSALRPSRCQLRSSSASSSFFFFGGRGGIKE